MRLLQRLTDVFSANVHDLVDRLEEPERMLRQSIRDMEATVDVAFHSAASVIAAGHLLERQIASRHAEIERLIERAQQAVRSGNDTLGRRSLVLRREQQAVLQSLTDQLVTTQEAERRLRQRLETLRHRLQHARCQLSTLVARQRSTAAQRRLLTSLGTVTATDQSFTRFDRFRDQIDQSEAELEAMRELTGVEEDEVEISQEIEREFEALKATDTV